MNAPDAIIARQRDEDRRTRRTSQAAKKAARTSVCYANRMGSYGATADFVLYVADA